MEARADDRRIPDADSLQHVAQGTIAVSGELNLVQRFRQVGGEGQSGCGRSVIEGRIARVRCMRLEPEADRPFEPRRSDEKFRQPVDGRLPASADPEKFEIGNSGHS